MTSDSICAVMVTYHPTAENIANIPNVLSQVQMLVVVDNCSKPESLNGLRQISVQHGFHLIENRDNLGIAEALNQGVQWAKDAGYPWVILFDQDSRLTPGFVAQMLATWSEHPQRTRVAAVHPRYEDPETHAALQVFRAKDGGPMTSMTSGALMPAWIFDKVGMFASELFIDLVDTEYCLRVRAASYLLADSQKAVLLHAAGAPHRRKILGVSMWSTHHNALRRYYITRNKIVVFRKYFWSFPGWVSERIYLSLRETIKCFIVEDHRGRKIRNTLLGIWDGVTGRMGKRESL